MSLLSFSSTRRAAHVSTFVEEQPSGPSRRDAAACFQLISVIVASKDALLARKALLACPQTGIVRCLPLPQGGNVKLEIRFPAGRGNAVIACILACLPDGQIGSVVACPDSQPARHHRARGNIFHLHGF